MEHLTLKLLETSTDLVFGGECGEGERLNVNLRVVEVDHLQDVVSVDGEKPGLVLTEIVHDEYSNIPGLTDRTASPEESGDYPGRIDLEIPVS